MFARITRYKLTPEGIDAIKSINAEIVPQVMALPGIVQYMSLSNPDGSASVIGVYETEAHAQAAEDKVKGMWGSQMKYIAEPPHTETFNVSHNSLSDVVTSA